MTFCLLEKKKILQTFCKSARKMFSDKNKIDETSGLSFIVISDNKIILFYEQKISCHPKLVRTSSHFYKRGKNY